MKWTGVQRISINMEINLSKGRDQLPKPFRHFQPYENRREQNQTVMQLKIRTLALWETFSIRVEGDDR